MASPAWGTLAVHRVPRAVSVPVGSTMQVSAEVLVVTTDSSGSKFAIDTRWRKLAETDGVEGVKMKKRESRKTD